MRQLMLLLWILMLVMSCHAVLPVSAEAEFRIVIMQDKKGSAAFYRPLLHYLNQNGIDASFVAARNYSHAAELFASHLTDGMFAGSGIAGCMIIKGLAYPAVRPVRSEGWSTYWAVVIGPKGHRRFTQNADYFNEKKVIFCGLASSGEFYFRSIVSAVNSTSTTLSASSHGAALDALSRGIADFAIIKNRIWDSSKDRYPELQRLGEDPGENPDGTLIIAKTVDSATVEKLVNVLLQLEVNPSASAIAVKEKLGIKGFIKTIIDDFKFTLKLLTKAGVDKNFDFSF